MSLIGLLTATEKQVVSGCLHMRPIQWHLKNHWHVPEVLEKEIPLPRSLYPHLQWWLDENNVLSGQPLHPLQHALQLFTDASNEGWGAHLGDHTAKGVWSDSESQLHINFLELKAVLLALKKFEQQCWGQIILIATDNTTVVSYINKEGGYEIRLTLCPPLETAFLVQSQTDSSKGQAHSGKAECDSRQIVQEHSGYSDRMVSPAGSLRPLMCQVALSSSGSLCNKVQSQTTQVCVPSTRSTGMESRCSQPDLGEYGCLRISSCVSFGQGGIQDPRSGSSQVGPDCSRVAQHALVLGSGQHVCSDSSLPSKRGEPAHPTIQSVSPQRSPRAQPPRLAPRASSIQAQGFSDEVATRIEAPQRQSTRAVYESKWSIFVKWCESHKVDFGSPSLNQVAEFLLFLFKEKNLQPSTIDGYRTAIADKIGCDKVNFGKDENLTRLLDSFHRDKPKGL